MSAEELRHIALPMLYGAPAYARPKAPIAQIERPFDPDDLPLQSFMTDAERALLEQGPSPSLKAPEAESQPDGRRVAGSLMVRSLTGRLRGRGD